jgi:4,5-DOPA dioxygenase extradiol
MNTATHISPVFISHGSPMTALEPGAAGAFMRRLGTVLKQRHPGLRAVVTVSAHTAARLPVLLAGARHEAVYDFGGFPAALSQLRYDVAGAPDLAPHVQSLLNAAGIEVHVAAEGGLDHGAWTPLRYMRPEADLPVLPLAFVPHHSPAQQMALGAALAPLADEGVLILASGSITHNLRRVFTARGMGPINAPEIPESAAFRHWMLDRSRERDWAALKDYRQRAPHAADMHPTDEHLLPWYVAAGAGGEGFAPQRLHESMTYGSLGMDAYAFGPGAAELAEALAAAPMAA